MLTFILSDRAEAAHRQRHRERDIPGRQPQGVLPLQASLHQVKLHPRLRRRRILQGMRFLLITVDHYDFTPKRELFCILFSTCIS